MRNRIENNAILLDQALYSGISFVSTLVLSHMLSLSQFGLYSTFVLLLFLLSGVTQALVIQPMQTKVKDLKSNFSYNHFLMSLQFLVAIFLVVFGMIAAFFQPSFLGSNVAIVFPFSLFASLFMLHDFFRKLFLAKAEKMKVLKMDIMYVVMQFIVLFLSWRLDIKNIGMLFNVMSLSLLPAIAFGVKSTLKDLLTTKVDWQYLTYHIREGKWFLSAAITQWFSNNIFVLSSGVFLSLEALGALRLVQTVFGIFNIFLQSVENYIVPQVNAILDSSMTDALHYLNSLLKKSLIFIIPSLALLYIFSEATMQFIGGDAYVPYHMAIRGFVVLYFIIFLFYPIRILIRSTAQSKSFFFAYLMSGAVGVLTCNFLFTHFALLGAVIGLIISQLIMLFLWRITLMKQKVNLWKLYI